MKIRFSMLFSHQGKAHHNNNILLRENSLINVPRISGCPFLQMGHNSVNYANTADLFQLLFA